MTETEKCLAFARRHADVDVIVKGLPGRIVGYAYDPERDERARIVLEARGPVPSYWLVGEPPGDIDVVLTVGRQVGACVRLARELFDMAGEVVEADYEPVTVTLHGKSWVAQVDEGGACCRHCSAETDHTKPCETCAYVRAQRTGGDYRPEVDVLADRAKFRAEQRLAREANETAERSLILKLDLGKAPTSPYGIPRHDAASALAWRRIAARPALAQHPSLIIRDVVAGMLDQVAAQGRDAVARWKNGKFVGTLAPSPPPPVWHRSHAPSPYLKRGVVICANCGTTPDFEMLPSETSCVAAEGQARREHEECATAARDARDSIDETERRTPEPPPAPASYRSPAGFGVSDMMGGAFWGYGWMARR